MYVDSLRKFTYMYVQFSNLMRATKSLRVPIDPGPFYVLSFVDLVPKHLHV